MMAGARQQISRFNVVSLALGLAFLYLPIVILVIYSFNASRLVTVWGGWSLRWYSEFFNDRAMLDAAWMSFRVAATSATIATLLGTLAAVALSRGERFRGRTLFSGMLYAPLVMPEVITGLSLLLLFVALNAERGFWTVTIAHTTLTMCFVAVVVQSRLGALDRSLEEAAMDLGCDPARAFLAVTLPLILPAIAAGWMLAFTLSLDDLVIASFTTGPGSETLPIRIYSEVRLGVKPEINAICTLVVGLIAVVIVVASLASKLSSARRRERRAVVGLSFRGDASIEPGISGFPDARLRQPHAKTSVRLRRPGLGRRARRRGRVGRGGFLSAAGEALEHRAHGVAGLAVLDRVEQRRGRRRAPDQAFRIGKDQRIVPRALHHERQFEAGRGRSAPRPGWRRPSNHIRAPAPRRCRSRSGAPPGLRCGCPRRWRCRRLNFTAMVSLS